jgi:hypothetical protein
LLDALGSLYWNVLDVSETLNVKQLLRDPLRAPASVRDLRNPDSFRLRRRIGGKHVRFYSEERSSSGERSGLEKLSSAPVIGFIVTHAALRSLRITPTGSLEAQCLSSSGSVIVNFEPLPTSLSTPISPPSKSISRLTMANPNPVPPYFLVVDISTWRNSSKI